MRTSRSVAPLFAQSERTDGQACQLGDRLGLASTGRSRRRSASCRPFATFGNWLEAGASVGETDATSLALKTRFWPAGVGRAVRRTSRRRSAIKRRSWAAASWRREDGRGDPGTAGGREDPHALGIAGAGTASGAGTRPGAAGGLTLPNRDSSGDPGATRAAGVGCVQGLSRPMAAVRRQGVTRRRRQRTTLFGCSGWAVHAQQISACIQRQVQGDSRCVPPLFCRAQGAVGHGKGRLISLSSTGHRLGGEEPACQHGQHGQHGHHGRVEAVATAEQPGRAAGAGQARARGDGAHGRDHAAAGGVARVSRDLITWGEAMPAHSEYPAFAGVTPAADATCITRK